MKNQSSKLDNWVLDKIKTTYQDDVALLIGHNAYRLEEDKAKATFSYFIPASENALKLARTFIIDGVGYDLFPMSWERLGRMAALDEDNASVVADATVLYSRSEADKQRFAEIQNTLKAHLKDPRFLLVKAMEKTDIVMGLYQGMLFEEALFKLRKAAAHIVLYLSHAVAYCNGAYFKTSHEDYLDVLKGLKSLPAGLIRLYTAIPAAAGAEELKKLCFEMIGNTRQYLAAKKENGKKPGPYPGYEDLADWYQELSYAWRQIYRGCDNGGAAGVFIRAGYLQSELDIVAEQFGLEEMDLMGSFNAKDLGAFKKRAEAVEKQIVGLIRKSSGKLDSYKDIDEFLQKNG
jgi:hypothetical protein